jgi:hypothetical protein
LFELTGNGTGSSFILSIAVQKGAEMAKKKAVGPKAGDAVAWESSAGRSIGKVVRRVTSPRRIKSHRVAASPENPEFIVRSDKTGKLAAHKAQALKKP